VHSDRGCSLAIEFNESPAFVVTAFVQHHDSESTT
jgi:hypothetical protein